MNGLEDNKLLRVWHIIGGKGFKALIPISVSSWRKGVKKGQFPQPVKLTAKCLGWKAEDIKELIEKLNKAGSK